MKKGLLIFIMLTAVFLLRGQGLLPEVSTESQPLWYYIQAVGEDTRVDRVFEAKGDYLYGEALNKNNDAQLFRFEKEGANYYIISKPTGKKVDAVMNADEETLGLSVSGVTFKFEVLNINYFNITSARAPVGGDASKIYAHQGNSASSYKILLVNTSWNKETNSQYSFVPYETVNIEYSSGTTEVWYQIFSAKPALGNQCVTDNTATTGAKVNFTVNESTEDNVAQQWKLVQKMTGSKVEFVNKATGNVIQTKSEAAGIYNSILFTQIMDESTGWNLRYLNGGQYVISGEEEDGIIRYWNFTKDGETPKKYNGANLIFSDFAWRLKKLSDSGGTDKKEISIGNNDIVVYAYDGRVFVKGIDEFQVKTIQGIPVDKKRQLPVGIYLVTVGNKTVKILVR